MMSFSIAGPMGQVRVMGFAWNLIRNHGGVTMNRAKSKVLWARDKGN